MDNILEVLIPIIFFIIWIFSSIAEANKKRQRRSVPPTGIPSPIPDRPSSANPPPVQSNPMDELKKTLENIFGEIDQQNVEEQKEKDVLQEIEEENEQPSVPVEATTVQRTVESSYKQRMKSEQEELKKFYENYRSEGEFTSMKISPETLRNSIVLMEIISPPVSLRE